MKRFFAILSVTFLLLLPAISSAAELSLSPSSGRLAIGDEFTITILADTGGELVNTAETNIVYSSDKLELVGVSQGSTFILPTPASTHTENNTIYVGGGLPSPGYNGKSGVLGVLRFKAKAIGKAQINVIRGRMLLNDGSGTAANVTLSGAQFDITPVAVGQVQVYSATHSDQQAWSNHNDVELGWILPAGATDVSYIWDHSPDTVPDDIIEPAVNNSISFPKTADGTWYFHIKARGKQANYPFGQTTNYKVQIDTIAPLPFAIGLVSENDTTNTSTTPTINYEATDATSGVSRYDVYMDGKQIRELAEKTFVFRKQEQGNHTIKVIAYDRAGNGTESLLPIKVTIPGQQPVTFDYVKKFLQLPVYFLVLINLLLVLLVASVLRNQRKQTSNTTVQAVQLQTIRSEIGRVVELDADLSQLRTQIDRRFVDMRADREEAIQDLRAELDHKLAAEIERNVTWMKREITNRIREASYNNPKVAEKIRQQVSENIAAEIAANAAKLKQVVDDNLQKVGPQYRRISPTTFVMHESVEDVSKRIEILEKLQSELRDYQA